MRCGTEQKGVNEMGLYELDTSSDQIVHWLRQELASGQPRVSYNATRSYVLDKGAETQNARLGEGDDIRPLVTIGSLEIRPVDAGAGWQLVLRIEDDVGAHAPVDGSVSDQPEDIDLDDFQTRFTATENFTEFANLHVESAAARRRFDDLFADIITDRHQPVRPGQS